MSAHSRKRFASIEALRRFRPETLVEFLLRFPDHLAAHGLRITPKTSESDLDYQKLVPLCMDISPD
ncbi:MAG: hypothetical protein JXQ75_02285, partial [Phycisphaerae bacterium]|nr:hypothetical protein [Phycisphaerae bacterium]